MSDRQKVRQNRTFITFMCCILSMVTSPYLLEGITVSEPAQAVAAGTLLGLAYLLMRPLLRLLTLPVGCLTLGLFNLAIDAALIWGCGSLIEGFQVATVFDALLAAVLVNSVCAIVGGFR